MNTKREPLLAIAGPVAAVALLLAAFGVKINHDQVDAITTAITVLTPPVSALVVWFVGRRKVTPVSDPQASDGTPLVPESDGPVD